MREDEEPGELSSLTYSRLQREDDDIIRRYREGVSSKAAGGSKVEGGRRARGVSESK